VLQVNIRDVSERKKVGQQLRRAEKLSALGQLIAGVAHELNNPLAVVMGFSQVMAKRTGLDEKTRNVMQRILHESERATKIVRDLLAFARPNDPQKTLVNINRLVASVVETQEAVIRAAGIQLESKLPADLPRTMADHGQIEQVLVNLITNAVYALSMREKPRLLTIRTEENGYYIRIVVADNGPGIPKEIIGQIFDPFFTTKPVGKGTGLGLTISNTIVQEHRGKILVESQPDTGTRFIVELPMIPSGIATAPAEVLPAPKRLPEQHTKRSILIVDDEPGIVEVLTEVISEIGHDVASATNGSEAMERIATGKYDVILSDMRMPGMDGVHLFETLKEKDEELAHRIIFVTGDTVSPDTRAFLESTGNRWLSKPFNVQQIIDTINEVLDDQPVSV
jgi:two-component system NtrC family sensor kinase